MLAPSPLRTDDNGASPTRVGYIEVRDGSAQFKRISTPVDLLPLVAAASLTAVAVKRLLAE